MYTYLGYRVEFLTCLPADKGYVFRGVIHIPEVYFYKFVFMHNQVDETTLRIVFDHATQKIHRFIDNLNS